MSRAEVLHEEDVTALYFLIRAAECFLKNQEIWAMERWIQGIYPTRLWLSQLSCYQRCDRAELEKEQLVDAVHTSCCGRLAQDNSELGEARLVWWKWRTDWEAQNEAERYSGCDGALAKFQGIQFLADLELYREDLWNQPHSSIPVSWRGWVRDRNSVLEDSAEVPVVSFLWRWVLKPIRITEKLIHWLLRIIDSVNSINLGCQRTKPDSFENTAEVSKIIHSFRRLLRMQRDYWRRVHV